MLSVFPPPNPFHFGKLNKVPSPLSQGNLVLVGRCGGQSIYRIGPLEVGKYLNSGSDKRSDSVVGTLCDSVDVLT